MKIDKDKLKQSLSVDEVVSLLRELGAIDVVDLISTKGHLMTNTICHNLTDGKLKLYYYPESFTFHCYTGCGSNFDIFELVQRNYRLRGIELGFSAIVEWVSTKTGKSFGFGYEVKESSSLDEDWEYFNKIRKKEPQKIELPKYNDRILDVFSKFHHPAFLNDGVSHEAMDKFEVTYYNKANRIVIPHRDVDGNLIGIKGRALNQFEIDNGYKYLPISVQDVLYNHPTHGNLYGIHQNIETIKKLGKAIIFESEKSVMQIETMFPNNNFSLATSGSTISQQQVRMLLDLNINEVIIAFDKEFEDEDSPQAKAYMKKILKIGRKFSNYIQTNVIWDSHGLIEYKSSPSDFGKDTLISLMKSKQEIRSKE